MLSFHLEIVKFCIFLYNVLLMVNFNPGYSLRVTFVIYFGRPLCWRWVIFRGEGG